MDFLKVFLPIIIYVLLIVLLVVLIIIGIKAISIMNRASTIVDDVEKKVKSLDGVFSVIENVSSKVNTAYGKITDLIIGTIERLTIKKHRKNEEDIDE